MAYRIVPIDDKSRLFGQKTKAIIRSSGEVVHIFDPFSNTDYVNHDLLIKLLTKEHNTLQARIRELEATLEAATLDGSDYAA